MSGKREKSEEALWENDKHECATIAIVEPGECASST